MTGDDKRYTGGELLAKTLAAAGVKRIFALHGGHLDAFFKGCIDEDIELIDVRHEAAAGHAADAYARTTGDLGVCAITAGPGFTNALTAMANAFLDASPVLFIIGAAPLREIETNPLQGGIDQIAAARPLTKWALSIPVTERIPDLAAMAVRKALTGRRGPVALEIPIDVLHGSVKASAATAPTGLGPFAHPAPSPSEAARLAALIRESRRPVIIAGMEAASLRTGEALKRFAGATSIPVFAKAQAMGLLGPDSPLDGGPAGNLAILPMIGVERPDLVILLGARMGLHLGGRTDAILPAAARIVQIHSDAAEIGRLRDVELSLACGCAEALDGVLSAAGSEGLGDFRAWAARATSGGCSFARARKSLERFAKVGVP